jgi:glyceraldehyde-3-phosphate dehydrogenase (NADP+)
MTAFFGNLLDGQILERGATGSPPVFIRSPYDQSVAGSLEEASLDQALQAASLAKSLVPYGRTLAAHRRSGLCQEIALRLKLHHEELARLITAESAKPIALARAEVTRAISTFSLAAAEALRFPNGEVLPLDVVASGEGYYGTATRVTAGAVLGICPFNFPLNLVAHKVAPALAVGAPVLIKPAPQAPLTALRLGQLFLESADAANVDPRLLQILAMPVDVASTLAVAPDFALLSFTGSASVGWQLKAQCGQKRIALELGGNAPAIVHSDADLDYAVQRCAIGAFAAAGQVCIKVQRILIHRPVYLRFRSAFLEKVLNLGIGDPLLDSTLVGPVIDQRSAHRINQWVEEAVQKGARHLLPPRRENNLLWPMVLESVPTQCRLAQEEVFGPVVLLEPYDRFGEALEKANQGQYGLQVGVFTSDLGRTRRATEGLDFGGVIINDVPMFRVDNFPYGGVKASGLGREGIRYAMEDMTEWKMIAHRIMPARKVIIPGDKSDPNHETNAAKLATELGNLWAETLRRRNLETLCQLYAKNAVLLATFQNIIKTPEDIKEYFSNLLEKPHIRVSFGETAARFYGPEVVSLCGLYSFHYQTPDGETEVKARFDMVWESLQGQWKIVEHHSSVCPVTNSQDLYQNGETSGAG